MGVKIFLPSDEQAKQLIENAIDDFLKKCAEHGMVFDEETTVFVKDMFVSGYCYGHNDCLDIIRGQFEAMEIQRI